MARHVRDHHGESNYAADARHASARTRSRFRPPATTICTCASAWARTAPTTTAGISATASANKSPETGAWSLQNEAGTGFTNPTATVLNGGAAGSNVWKWVKITGSQGPAAWVVPAGALTQTFQWGSREDGMLFDKFAFGPPVSATRWASSTPAGRLRAPARRRRRRTAAVHAHRVRRSPTGNGQVPRQRLEPGTASLNFVNYWNQVTPENGGKWGSASKARATSSTGRRPTRRTRSRRTNGLPFKWHTLVWGNQQPAGSKPARRQSSSRRSTSGSRRSRPRYPDIEQIEVVNEPLHDPPRGPTNGNYMRGAGRRRRHRVGLDHQRVHAGASVLPERQADAQRLQHHQRRQCDD